MKNETINWREILKDCTFHKKDDLEKSFLNILEYIKDSENKVKKMEEQLEEYNKDTEIQKLKKEIEDLKNELAYGSKFEITAEENEKIKEWINKHIEEKHNGNRYAGAIGGQFIYEFIPTSIGTVGTIKCSCGDSFCFCELV